MPFNCIPAKDFLYRRDELLTLKGLPDLRERHLAGNILLEGECGIGKTELLKQLYRMLYWDDTQTIPFYYAFSSAALRADVFARDYLHRFIGQYLSFMTKNPSLMASGGLPATKAIPQSSVWLLDLLEEFEGLRSTRDVYGQLITALSAPVHAAEKNVRPVLVLLDNFELVCSLYESTPGDLSGLAGFFETPIKAPLCPHIVSGSPPEMLESIFASGALRGTVERMVLSPLPEESACMLFKSFCDEFGIREERETSLAFMRFLGCNPLYIRGLARSLSRMNKKHASERDLRECYSHEITDGQIALYLQSLLSESAPDPATIRLALRVYMHCMESQREIAAHERLSKILGTSQTDIHKAFAVLKKGGFIHGMAGCRLTKDSVRQDFMKAIYLREIEAKRPERVREIIINQYDKQGDQADWYEITLPCTPEAELIAAKALEQIGSNLMLRPDVMERLQLALIEACINAIEHSGSFEKKVFVRFGVTRQRLDIAVESAGRFFDPTVVEPPDIKVKLSSRNKRGWGLKLIQSIMDEVHIERIDDRTRVLLVKKIRQEEVLLDTNAIQS